MSNLPTELADFTLHDENSFEEFSRQYYFLENNPPVPETFSDSVFGARKCDDVKVLIKNANATSIDQHGFYNRGGRAVLKEYEAQLKASNGNPYVVKPLGWFKNSTGDGFLLVVEHDKFYISLGKYISLGGIRECEVKKIFQHLLYAVMLCHENGVARLSLAAGNDVLVAPIGHDVKLANFHLAGQHGVNENVGTRDAETADLHGMGSLLYEMLQREMLSEKKLPCEMRRNKPAYESWRDCWSFLKHVEALVYKGLQTFDELDRHPWLDSSLALTTSDEDTSW